DGNHLALLDQAGERAMSGVGGRFLQNLVAGELATPGLAAGLGGGQKVAELDRPHLRPDAAGRTVVGNTRFGGDAGARESDNALRVGDHLPQLVDLCHGPSSLALRQPRSNCRMVSANRPERKTHLAMRGEIGLKMRTPGKSNNPAVRRPAGTIAMPRPADVRSRPALCSRMTVAA